MGDTIQSALAKLDVPVVSTKVEAKTEAGPGGTPQETPKVETPLEVKPVAPAAGVVETPKPGSPAAAMAEVVRREKAIRTQQDELKATAFQLRQQQETFQKVLAQNHDLKKRMAEDPFGTLEKEFGIPYTKLAQMAVSDEAVTAAPQANPEIEALKNMILELKNQIQSEKTGKTTEGYIQEYKGMISTSLSQEKYELLKTMPEASDKMFALAQEYAKKTGQVLPPEQAADTLLTYWTDHLRSTLSNAAALKLLGLPGTPAPTPDAQEAPTEPPATLSGALTQTPAKGPANTTVTLSSMNARQEIMAALALMPQKK